MTVMPIAFVILVSVLYAAQRVRLSRQAGIDHAREIEYLQAKCMFVVLTFLYTVFPILSSLVMQTFVYDDRLENGEGFLKADYSIQREDSHQQMMQVYAMAMGLLYCIGIPASTYALLRWKKKVIQKLQSLELRSIHVREGSPQIADDTEEGLNMLKTALKEHEPMLDGLSFLYKDYESQFWWWEVLRFLCTFVLCGVVTLTNLGDKVQVFVALVASAAMLGAVANCKPYLEKLDDVLSQSCQVTLSLVLAVGLLDSVSELSFGWMLITCSAGILALGGGTIVLELLKVFFPKKMESFMVGAARRLGCLMRLPSPSAVAPFVGTSIVVMPLVDTSNDVKASEGLGNIPPKSNRTTLARRVKI